MKRFSSTTSYFTRELDRLLIPLRLIKKLNVRDAKRQTVKNGVSSMKFEHVKPFWRTASRFHSWNWPPLEPQSADRRNQVLGDTKRRKKQTNFMQQNFNLWIDFNKWHRALHETWLLFESQSADWQRFFCFYETQKVQKWVSSMMFEPVNRFQPTTFVASQILSSVFVLNEVGFLFERSVKVRRVCESDFNSFTSQVFAWTMATKNNCSASHSWQSNQRWLNVSRSAMHSKYAYSTPTDGDLVKFYFIVIFTKIKEAVNIDRYTSYATIVPDCSVSYTLSRRRQTEKTVRLFSITLLET